jgi:single-stranded-DNA-specific exonuclease
LNPKLASLPSPFDLKGIDAAVSLILDAVSARQQVIIHGDYDVDGITATILLADFIAKLDIEVIYHLPNRMQDGYGVSLDSVAYLADKVRMPALFITVDCGISANEEVRYAKELGFKVIVTDHHTPPQLLPEADAIINPKQQGCAFPFKGLCGAGVVFFLAMAVRRKMVDKGFWDRENVPNLKSYLDLVALGTVADVMDLVDVNRVLVKAGLEVISARKRPGIWALCRQAGISEGVEVTSEDISFRLAPRINAAGRLGEPEVAAKLLASRESSEALEWAALLEKANNQRRELEKKAVADALEQAEKQLDVSKKGLVLLGMDWHPGVVGIIAARVVDQFALPVLVFTADTCGDGGILKASGRSVDGLNLYDVLTDCKSTIIQFGGHAMAAGLTVREDDLEQFAKDFNKAVSLRMDQVGNAAALQIDMIVDATDNCEILAQNLKLMEPFGRGNPEPIFLIRNIRMEKVSRLREHLKFSLPMNGSLIHGIGFFMAEDFQVALNPVDLGLKLKTTNFRGRKRVEAHAVSIRPTI